MIGMVVIWRVLQSSCVYYTVTLCHWGQSHWAYETDWTVCSLYPTYSTHVHCCMPSEWQVVSVHLIPRQASQRLSMARYPLEQGQHKVQCQFPRVVNSGKMLLAIIRICGQFGKECVTFSFGVNLKGLQLERGNEFEGLNIKERLFVERISS